MGGAVFNLSYEGSYLSFVAPYARKGGSRYCLLFFRNYLPPHFAFRFKSLTFSRKSFCVRVITQILRRYFCFAVISVIFQYIEELYKVVF